MSSSTAGDRINELAPPSVYAHCSSHYLDLVVAISFNKPVDRDMMAQLKAVCMFFNFRDTRNGLLTALIKHTLDVHNPL